MMIVPKRKEIGDPSKQPKALAPQRPLKKQPCNFCMETRRVVQKVSAKVFRKLVGR